MFPFFSKTLRMYIHDFLLFPVRLTVNVMIRLSVLFFSQLHMYALSAPNTMCINDLQIRTIFSFTHFINITLSAQHNIGIYTAISKNMPKTRAI